jgi:putative SOS response-associated peptidase YedK
MCGRYTLTAESALLEDRFACRLSDVSYRSSYNIAPGQAVMAVVKAEAELRAGLLRWGLVPSWAKDPKMGYRMINARAETVAEKPSFRRALRQRRCLILADGFYEWRREGRQKTPMYIRLRSGEPFAFAGIWEHWQGPDGTPLSTCAILTTAANALMQPIHQRMPVMLDRAAESLWLDGEVTEPQALLPVLAPFASEAMEAYEVSSEVNSARHNSPACITPVAPA